MRLKKPKGRFIAEPKEIVRYKNATYRLPVELLNEMDLFLEELAKHPDESMSAGRFVEQVVRWALKSNRKK